MPSIQEFLDEGLTFQEAVMAQEAMSSSVLEGAQPISAKRMVELIKSKYKVAG